MENFISYYENPNLSLLNVSNSSWESIGVAIMFSIVLVIVLITLSFLLSIKKPDAEKLTPYECGFQPFDHSRTKFDIRYYLVCLLFILFDLEVLYLFPLISVDFLIIKSTGFYSFLIFLIILAIGILYEYSKSALESV